MESLTSKSYWAKYYLNSNTSKEEIIRICSQDDKLWELMSSSCSSPPKTIIEIGSYPGRYLAYLSSKYLLQATALDYNSEVSKIYESFYSIGGNLKEIIQEDFLKYEPNEKYDIVLSIGFIEHFEKFREVMDRHVLYLNPGGIMLIIIPNKRYLRNWYGYLVDYSNLKAHNLKSMRLSVFRNFAGRNNLKIKYLSYYGGFAFRVHQPLNLLQKIIYKATKFMALRMNAMIETHPNPFLSGSIVGIFHKTVM